MSWVETALLEQIREVAMQNATYDKILQWASDGFVRRYWIEDGLHKIKGGGLYVIDWWNMGAVIKETHDQWLDILVLNKC